MASTEYQMSNTEGEAIQGSWTEEMKSAKEERAQRNNVH